MSPVDVDTLRARQLAFFLERVTGEKAEAEWRAVVARALETWLDTPLDQLTTPGALARAVEASFTEESFAEAIGPLSRAAHMQAVRDLRRQKEKLGYFVPPSAREKLDALLARPNLGAERLLRQVLAQDAMEETMRDVLYDALKEFNEKVNPFVADWGLPGIMKKLGPFGFGPLAKSIEGVSREFDRRLEPEMRKFLQGFSRKALDKTGDLIARGGAGGKWGELRTAVLSWLYEQEIRELLVDLDEEGALLLHGLVLDVAARAASLEDVRVKWRSAWLEWFAAHATQTLRSVVADHGVSPVFDAGAIAEATWPAVRAVVSSAPVADLIGGWLDEFWDGEKTDG